MMGVLCSKDGCWAAMLGMLGTNHGYCGCFLMKGRVLHLNEINFKGIFGFLYSTQSS